MNWFTRLRKRRHLEEDLADEIAFHRAMRSRDPEAPPFGNQTRIRESIRDAWSFGWIETVLRDVAFSIRGLRRNPGFALTAIGSLAIGIGITIAIFTAADGLLFRPMPYKQPDRLVMVWERSSHVDSTLYNVISPGNFFDWKARAGIFEDLAAFTEGKTTFADGDRVEQLAFQNVSANFFSILGVRPERGRAFTAAEDLASAHDDTVVIVSHRLWQSWFAGDPNIVGRRVLINAVPRTVIGVMPAGFYFRDREVDLWSPAGLDPARPYRKTSGRYMMAVGRLRPGVTARQAQARMTELARVLEIENPVFDKNWTAIVEPLRDSLVRDVRISLLILLGAVGLLLAVASVNVANLLLARNCARRSELAVRNAIGAGRGRLARQLLTESLTLAFVAGIAGIILGRLALAGLLAIAPREMVRTAVISVDWRIVLFALLVSTTTGVFFGLMPALSGAKAGIAGEMRLGSRWSSRHTGLARSWLAGVEVALSVMLLAGAGILIHSLVRLQGARPGLNANNVLTFRIALPAARYRDAGKATRFFATLLNNVDRRPGVRSASGVSYLPFTPLVAGTSVAIGGHPEPKPGEQPNANIRTVMPRYFETMGIPLRRGRDFADGDNTIEAPIRFIVNEAFVRRYMPNEDPLGKTISVAMDRKNPFGEIIGIAGDQNEGTLTKAAEPLVYYNHAHLTYSGMTIVVRLDRETLNIVPDIRRIVRELDPALPVADVRTMREVLGETYARERFSAMLLTGFSISALLLTAIGIYGVLGYSITERTREIGVRLAVGAGAGRIVSMVLSDAAWFVFAGLAVGIAGAFAASRWLESLLFEIGPRDPVSFIATPAILLAVAILAAWIPARRAAKLDPISALRVE